MADIAYDLLIDLERADSHSGVTAERRRAITIMQEQGFSDAEIALALGTVPEPARDEEIATPRVCAWRLIVRSRRNFPEQLPPLAISGTSYLSRVGLLAEDGRHAVDDLPEQLGVGPPAFRLQYGGTALDRRRWAADPAQRFQRGGRQLAPLV